jgi:hypothetical protein
VGCREEFLSEKFSVVLWLFLFKGGEVLEAVFLSEGFFRGVLDTTSQTGFPCLVRG